MASEAFVKGWAIGAAPFNTYNNCKIAALPRRREEWKMDSEQKHRK